MPIIDKGLLFNSISNQLDITPLMYKLALDRVDSVTSYLKGNGIDADFYLQGSFRYGTIIRPLRNGKEGDYDVDVVCQLRQDKLGISPSNAKNLVGNALKENEVYRRILDDEGKRCWTLEYAEQGGMGFHMDILPSVQEEARNIDRLINLYRIDPGYATTAIAITDKIEGAYYWSSGNPKGYGLWFDNINRPFFNRLAEAERKVIYENNKLLFKSPVDVPAPLVRTPLQRVIQILKRHRDARFNGHPLENEKPISMIITTIVASIVKNEQCTVTDTFALLNFVVDRLVIYSGLIRDSQGAASKIPNAVIKRDSSNGKWYIPNPVDPEENFANRWHEDDNKRAKAFFQWASWVKEDLVNPLNNSSFDIQSFKSTFGDSIVEKAQKNYQDRIKPVAPINIISPTKPYGESGWM